MASDALQDELFRPFPSDLSAFAVLDLANAPRLWPALQSSGAPYHCLFRGALHPALRAAAPHLVELVPDGAFTRWLLAEPPGRFGIFLRSAAGMDALYGHFRRFLRVADERGKKFYFRFYDPRVLNLYLPTCNAEELLAWFEGLECFLAEEVNGREVAEHQLSGGRLVTRILPRGGQGP